MSNYSTLKNDIDNNIFENQTQQITGAALNSILKEMVNTLGEGYQFGGIVTPESSVPSSDAKLFFVACTEGEYNFVDELGDHIEVAEGEVAIIYGNRKAVIAPSKWLTLFNDVPSFGYDESDPVTLAEQMGHSIEDVLAKGFVVYNDDVTTNHYIVVGDYGAEGGYITFIGRNKVYQYNVNADGYITDEQVTSLAPDDELSDTSENAVQNKVVKAAMDSLDAAKQNVLTFDNVPTAGSNNPITSGGVKTALDKLGQLSYDFNNQGGININGNSTSQSLTPYYRVSDYIKIVGGENIYGYSITDAVVVSFYDINKTWLGSLNPTNKAMNNVVLSDENIPENAVYFRAGTLLTRLEESYILQPVKNTVEQLNNTIFTEQIELMKEQGMEVDGIITKKDFNITNARLIAFVNLEEDEVDLMLKCSNPPSAGFTIYRNSKYLIAGWSTGYSGCEYNKFVTVQKDNINGKNILIFFDSNSSETAINVPATLIFKKHGDSISERVLALEQGQQTPVFGSGQRLDEVNIVDGLNSDNPNNVLSAKQGKIIGDELFGGATFDDVVLSLDANKYYNTNLPSGLMPENPTAYADSGYYCAKLSVVPGQILKIFGLGYSGSLRLYAFADSNLTRLDRAENDVDYRTNGHEITVPENAAWFFINFNQYNSSSDKLQKRVISAGVVQNVANLKVRVTTLENKIVNPLNGKKIVCFGDSLTENKDSNGKSWTDYASEFADATFINVAVGGSQLRQRVKIEIFNPEHSYTRLVDYVYYKPDGGTMKCYQCSTNHSGAWDASHFAESTNSNMYAGIDISSLIEQCCSGNFSIGLAAVECIYNQFGSDYSDMISTLQSMDWASVDAVIIWGGTNDFTVYHYGETGDVTKYTTFGAVDYIVNQFCATYKKIPMYYLSTIVRWKDYTGGNGDAANWCDDLYIYPLFTESTAYAVGERTTMMVDNVFGAYSCINAHQGAWDENDFQYIGPSYTYKEFSKLLTDEFSKRHIPFKDLYNTLGWNKFNFSEYFNNNDGTHPLKGLRKISHAICSYISANVVF